MDLYGQVGMLDNGARLGKTMMHFTDTYFHEKVMDRYSLFTPKKDALEAAMTKVKDLCITLRPEDYFVLDKPRMSTVYVDLPDDAQAIYDELETDFITSIDNVGIRAMNSAVLQGKLLQIASGALYTKAGGAEWSVVHDEKLDALESIIEELGGEQLLVVYEFQSDLARLKERFPKARELKTQRDEDDWNRGDGTVPLMLIHPQSAGHGINLQHGGRNIAFFSHSFNLETYEQVRERLGVVRQMQSGYKRTVNEFYIVARNTVDEPCIAKRDKKADVQELIMSYAKAKNLPVLKKAA
jgi:SNF2 family DNA or RNA helicase